MEAAQSEGGKTRKARGRKDSDGQEAVIKMESLTTRLEDLIGMYKGIEQSVAEYGEAVKATAEQAGLHSDTVRKVVKAKAGEKFDQINGKVQQLALAFSEVAE